MTEHEMPRSDPAARVQWRTYTNDSNETGLMLAASAAANISMIRAKPWEFDVLLDEPNIFMWRWKDRFDKCIVTYVKEE
jgi:hypothetical protein